MSEEATPAEPDDTNAGWAMAFGRRFLFVYLLFYFFPFPLWVIPYVGESLSSWASKPLDFLASLVGEGLLGMSLMDFKPNGSGDTSEAYAYLVLGLIVSTTVAAIWTVVSRPRQHTLLVQRLRLLSRWYLGYMLLLYGFSKVIPLQFPFPNDFRLTQPLGDFSPMGIAWAFMGASPAYVIFSGAMEVLAGGLLLFRRTSTAGALVAAAVLTNVVALNFCYDIPVKLFSSHLLLLGLWIVLPHAKRLFSAVVLGRAVGAAVNDSPFARPWVERLRTPVGALLVLYFFIHLSVTSTQRYRERHSGESRLSLSGVYLPEGDTISHWTHFYVSPNGWVKVRAPGAEKATFYRIAGTESDKRKANVELDLSTIVLERYDDHYKMVDGVEPLRFSTHFEDELLTLTPLDEPNVLLRFRRKDTSTYLLRTRGFNWVNEVPYNRP